LGSQPRYYWMTHTHPTQAGDNNIYEFKDI
jgi:hypothetical protein